MTAFQNPPGAQGSAYERYRYLVGTASPAEIETAHEQAFARMTPLARGGRSGARSSRPAHAQRTSPQQHSPELPPS